MKLFNTIKQTVRNIRAEWDVPKKGNAVPYKELTAYSVGGIGVNTINTLFTNYLALNATTFLMGPAFGIEASHLAILALISNLFMLIRTPLISMMIDNTKSKKGKFRPYLLWTGLPTAILISIIPYVSEMEYMSMVIWVGVIYNLIAFFQQIYSLAYNNLAQVMTFDTNERSKVLAVSAFVYNLGPSIINMILPMFAALLGGLTNIETFKVLLPCFAVIGYAISILAYTGTKEKTIVSKDYVAKVKFSVGVKESIRNKYFWVINLNAILGVLKGSAGMIVGWITTYALLDDGVLFGLANTVLGTAAVPGMLLAPLMIKKFGKRKVMVFSHIFAIVFITAMLFSYSVPIVFLVFLYLHNLSVGMQFVVTQAMTGDMMDYQQLKSGQRLEGFMTQFGAMLLTAVNMGAAFILPALYKLNGLGRDYDILYVDEIRNPIFRAILLVTLVSAVLALIPLFFYDLTEKKHQQIVAELTIRAQERNKELEGVLEESTGVN